MKIIATIEARMASSRLPGKSIAPVGGKPILQHIIERLRKVALFQEIVVATTVNKEDIAIQNLADELDVSCFRGSADDVLGRVIGAAKSVDGELIFQYGADCPFVDVELIECLFTAYRQGRWDFVSNTLELTYPLGIVGTIVSRATLEEVSRRTEDPLDREDVTRYIWEHPKQYRLYNHVAPPDLHHPELRLTVDYPQDLELVRAIFAELSPVNPWFSARDVVSFLLRRPELAAHNSGLVQRSAPFLPRNQS